MVAICSMYTFSSEYVVIVMLPKGQGSMPYCHLTLFRRVGDFGLGMRLCPPKLVSAQSVVHIPQYKGAVRVVVIVTFDL